MDTYLILFAHWDDSDAVYCMARVKARNGYEASKMFPGSGYRTDAWQGLTHAPHILAMAVVTDQGTYLSYAGYGATKAQMSQYESVMGIAAHSAIGA